MIKIVCDKCGREVYMKNPDLTGRAKIGFEEYDLCKYCILDIKRFINQSKAARKDNSSEIPNNSTISKMEQVDEPHLTPNYCGTCKHREVPCGDLPCDVCHSYSNYEPKDEPQTEYERGYQQGKKDEHRWWSEHCANCTDEFDEPQTDCAWK